MQVGVACLLVILFLVFAIGVIHYWTSNNFYLTRTQMLLVCSLAFFLALAAFLMGLFQGDYIFLYAFQPVIAIFLSPSYIIVSHIMHIA